MSIHGFDVQNGRTVFLLLAVNLTGARRSRFNGKLRFIYQDYICMYVRVHHLPHLCFFAAACFP